MSTEHMILGGAVVVFLFALAYAVRNRNAAFGVRAAIINAAEPLKRFVPAAEQAVEPSIEELLVRIDDRIDLRGKLEAAGRRVGKLTSAAADEHETRLASRLAPKDPPAAS